MQAITRLFTIAEKIFLMESVDRSIKTITNKKKKKEKYERTVIVLRDLFLVQRPMLNRKADP